MDISKINGTVAIINGKLESIVLTNDGVEIKLEIDKFLAMKAIMDSKYFNYEKEIQANFKNNMEPYILPKDIYKNE